MHRNRARSQQGKTRCALHHDTDCDDPEAAFDAQLEAYLKDSIQPVVEENDWAVQHISTEDHRLDFNYTIGLTSLGYPELLLVGYHPVVAGILLELLATHLRDHVAADDVRAPMRVYLPIGPDEAPVAFWLIAPTPQEDRDRGPGMAKAFYQRWVPHLVVKPAGWPCDRCTSEYDELTRCTCKFACSWHLCHLKQGGGIPLEVIAGPCNHDHEETHEH